MGRPEGARVWMSWGWYKQKLSHWGAWRWPPPPAPLPARTRANTLAKAVPRPSQGQTPGQPGGGWKFQSGLGSTNTVWRQSPGQSWGGAHGVQCNGGWGPHPARPGAILPACLPSSFQWNFPLYGETVGSVMFLSPDETFAPVLDGTLSCEYCHLFCSPTPTPG